MLSLCDIPHVFNPFFFHPCFPSSSDHYSSFHLILSSSSSPILLPDLSSPGVRRPVQHSTLGASVRSAQSRRARESRSKSSIHKHRDDHTHSRRSSPARRSRTSHALTCHGFEVRAQDCPGSFRQRPRAQEKGKRKGKERKKERQKEEERKRNDHSLLPSLHRLPSFPLPSHFLPLTSRTRCIHQWADLPQRTTIEHACELTKALYSINEDEKKETADGRTDGRKKVGVDVVYPTVARKELGKRKRRRTISRSGDSPCRVWTTARHSALQRSVTTRAPSPGRGSDDRSDKVERERKIYRERKWRAITTGLLLLPRRLSVPHSLTHSLTHHPFAVGRI